ncbi:MAG: serine O-acetyltransferase EpsC [Ferrovibrionaceae bacterium]
MTDPWNLGDVVAALHQSREAMHKIRHRGRLRELPSRDVLMQVIAGLQAAMFPTHYGRPDLSGESIDFFVGDTLHGTLQLLVEQVRRALRFADEASDDDPMPQAVAITRAFAARLAEIRALLVSDLHAAVNGDPAASNVSEVLLCYPGFSAIVHYRLAHALYRAAVPMLPRLITSIAQAATGVDIHPAADIGGSFFIDHASGVVIGETTIIGRNVRLYQAVTLGAKSFPKDETGALVKGRPRHPIVEDDVVIYAGATILGRITIGKGSVIGGNVWLTQSVPPGSNVTQAQMRSS